MLKITVCDILRDYGQEYLRENKIKGQQKGIVNLLSSCQSSALGSHYRQCEKCAHLNKAYNSCRNRHCPNCQNKDREKWLDKRMKDLLPIGYYHLVFTIPHQLNALCLQNKGVLYGILFKAASQTVLELSQDVKHLGADTGLITILHTWGQNMMEHPHLHCIMPAGGLSFDKTHWVSMPKADGFFVHYKTISRKFRGKFLDLLSKAYLSNQLTFAGKAIPLKAKKNFTSLTSQLYAKEWVVNIQKPFARPQKVLEYLSRYVFRIAISDQRIEKVENGMVYFTIKDYRNKGVFRKMKLQVNEFVRRFLLHLLPKGFFKIRYYGILANVHRKANIERANYYLTQQNLDNKQEALEDGNQFWEKQDTVWTAIMQDIKTQSQFNCPVCKKGHMRFAGAVAPSLAVAVSLE